MAETVWQHVFAMSDSDALRKKVNAALEPGRKSALGQFMTPSVIAQFMASLFDDPIGPATVLDAGAGIGSLSIAAVQRLGKIASVDAWEVDPVMRKYLEENLKVLGVDYKIHSEDFIHSAVQRIALANGRRYTHAILNPPYKKLNSGSVHRALLRKIGIETVNLYTAFVALSVLLMQDQGQIVAIIPRSFCNGPYYRPFRHLVLNRCSLERIHVFESRSKTFQDDDVLQENVIIKLIRGKAQGRVVVSTSHDQRLTDYRERSFPFSEVVKPTDAEAFIHVPTEERESFMDGFGLFEHSLEELRLEVCTGPVVDFRLKQYWLADPDPDAIPLIYPHHFSTGALQYPKRHKKPNALEDRDEVRHWLMPNECYVLVKRFSSKEEKRRVVAYVYDPKGLHCKQVGFENHWNVFHSQHSGIDPVLASGLACFLNSTSLDKHFRLFSGHTQVNATDLRTLKYPGLQFLIALGKQYHTGLTQSQIDAVIRQTHEQREKAERSPRHSCRPGASESATEREDCTVPTGASQPNAYRAWDKAESPRIGITPIMDWARKHYGKDYAPNTRETVRRQSMHQFVQAGVCLYNPDKPERPVNSPHAVYQIAPEVLGVLRTYTTPEYEAKLEEYLSVHRTLSQKYAKEREMAMVPLKSLNGVEIILSAGDHSLLIKAIVEEFAPRFIAGGRLVYLGDTGDKYGYFDVDLLAELGVTLDNHGKLPDVVVYAKENNWLFLIESVTSHGPVDAKRHAELEELFASCTAGRVYVSAFPNRKVFMRYLEAIAWETEVWIADAPTHLVHFNGPRFLGPYTNEKQ